MKKVLKDTSSLRVLGFKKQILALAVCFGVGLGTISIAEAAPSRNVNPPALKANAPHVYIVKKGDTLWDISKKFLKNPYRWREIWASNKHVKNPHWIFPGDRLLMCTYNGRPIIGKDEGDGCDGIIRRYGNETINLQPQVRVESLNNTIPVIPLDGIKNWLERSNIVPVNSTKNMPYVVGAKDQRVLAAKGQNIYVRGNGLEIGQRYSVYRENDPYIMLDAKGKKYNAGLELVEVASGIATKQAGDITTLEVTDSYNSEIRRGYFVMQEYEAMLPTLFYPVNAEEVIAGGKVIRVQGSIGAAAVGSVVSLDRGTNQGVKVGHVFNVNELGQAVKDQVTNETIQLPSENVGSVMVFKAFDNISYAYVLESSLPINVGAALTPPIMND
ncbi:LysM peptidoglycan-binding domain-containing protein [Acinetobacter sp. ANC 7201]|uniref:LysM peptidoglycan-binding domain-containing protein n=1 Tax=Acinetobacter sp. ANC 7201 TaxID=3035288 RepID=UPI0027A332EC|nr:LysM peptidoglycan-binding domain-containing protein [Acinetobacter sp. ANC 7201]WFP96966.1 LysM peptidoglycan-binding domain-containing protein [Acinetobacter sp. ANC 7201]